MALVLNTKRNIKLYWGRGPLPETMIALGVISGDLCGGRIVSGVLFAAASPPYERFYVGNAGTYAALPTEDVMEAILFALSNSTRRREEP